MFWLILTIILALTAYYLREIRITAPHIKSLNYTNNVNTLRALIKPCDENHKCIIHLTEGENECERYIYLPENPKVGDVVIILFMQPWKVYTRKNEKIKINGIYTSEKHGSIASFSYFDSVVIECILSGNDNIWEGYPMGTSKIVIN